MTRGEHHVPAFGLVALLLVAAGAAACSNGGPQGAAPAARTAGEPAPAPPPDDTPGRTLTDAKNLSLDQLAQRADRIFVGVVQAVDHKSVRLTDAGESTEAEVRDVTIAVKDGIKNATTGETVVVRQLEAVSAALRPGEEILWFLAKNSRLGLTQPLGVSSGDFRVQTTENGTRVVNNLRGNAGLWQGDLFRDDGFERGEVIDAARDMKLPEARIKALEARAIRAPDQQNLPLDLLVAATRSQIK